MITLHEQLARAQCAERRAAAEADRLALRALRQRRAARLTDRAARLSRRAGAWTDVASDGASGAGGAIALAR